MDIITKLSYKDLKTFEDLFSSELNEINVYGDKKNLSQLAEKGLIKIVNTETVSKTTLGKLAYGMILISRNSK